MGGRPVLGYNFEVTSMLELAAMYRATGQWAKAEELQEHVLTVGEGPLGKKKGSSLTAIAQFVARHENRQRVEAEEWIDY
jgi:hypothetical protein